MILGTIIYSLVASSTPMQPQKKITHEQVLVQSNIAACRSLIAELTKERPNVMKQFDAFAANLKNFSDADMGKIMNAVTFAAQKHRLQTRKDAEKTPYIIHPIGVANNLITIGNVRDVDVIIGALLHDTVEDTQTTFEEIGQKFGARVAGLVKEVTDDKSLSKEARKELQIEHAAGKSEGAALIKLTDKLYNLRDLSSEIPTGWDKERVDAYFRWAQAVVERLPKVNSPLKQAIDHVIQKHWE